MTRHAFTVNLFRSRTVALAHLALFYAVAKGGQSWAWATTAFWFVVLCYNIRSRWLENRLPWRAAKRMVEAAKAVNEGRIVQVKAPEESMSIGYCFDCAAEGVQIEAQYSVAAGPNGEKKPVCLIHARAQAVKNAEENEKTKEPQP